MRLFTKILLLLLLNGCIKNAAFLGPAISPVISPAITVVSTGSIYRAGLSFGSNLMIKKVTGKTSLENFQQFLIVENDDNKIVNSLKVGLEKQSQEFIKLKKKDNKILRSANESIKDSSKDFYVLVNNLYLQDQANQ